MKRPVNHIMLATGGTGGHVTPALAVAGELKRRGHDVSMMIDERGARYVGEDGGLRCHAVRAGTFARGSVLRRLLTPLEIALGVWGARRVIRSEHPDALVGFGGYTSLPAVLAANMAGVPTCLHEQNAVLGRVNRFIARRARVLALTYPHTQRIPASAADRVVVTGNPVRDEIAALAGRGYHAPAEDEACRLLVLGGSQGATILSDVVPDAVSLLQPAIRDRLVIEHQARPADQDMALAKYQRAGATAVVRPFFEDIAQRLAEAHLVIARAGASTIAEITAAGRPSVLIPYPAAMDDHQRYNAADVVDVGGAFLIDQADFDPKTLAKRLHALLGRPEALTRAARAARSVARPDAAGRLSDLIEEMAAETAGGMPA